MTNSTELDASAEPTEPVAPLTYEQVLERVEPFVRDKPDNVAACMYFDYDEHESISNASRPMCIVGHAFEDELRPHIIAEPGDNSNRFVAVQRSLTDLKLTGKASRFIGELQHAQDRGVAWAQALIQAKTVARAYTEAGFLVSSDLGS